MVPVPEVAVPVVVWNVRKKPKAEVKDCEKERDAILWNRDKTRQTSNLKYRQVKEIKYHHRSSRAMSYGLLGFYTKFTIWKGGTFG